MRSASQTLTYTLKLHPEKSADPDAELKLLITMDLYAEACDLASRFAWDYGCETASDIHFPLYSLIRAQCFLPSQLACNVFRTVLGNIKAIRAREREGGKKGSMPAYRRPFCSYSRNRDYSFKANDIVSLNTFAGRVEIPYSIGKKAREVLFSKGSEIGAAKLRWQGGLRIDVSVTVPILISEPADIPPVVGVDSGINKIFAASGKDRDIIVLGGKIKNRRAKEKALREELQRRHTPAARRKLKKAGSRENRYVGDVLHCAAKALVDSYPAGTVFAMEDLHGIRATLERVRLGQRYLMVSWPYGKFLEIAAYKARLRGQLVMLVPPDYSSQRCPKCGHISRDNRDRKNHRFKCSECGYASNDDRVGAMNLRAKGEYAMSVYYSLGLSDFEGLPSRVCAMEALAAMRTSVAGFLGAGADVSRPETGFARFWSIRRQRGGIRVQFPSGDEGRRGNPVRTYGQSQAPAFMQG